MTNKNGVVRQVFLEPEIRRKIFDKLACNEQILKATHAVGI